MKTGNGIKTKAFINGTLKQIGTVGVDSGQILITDPCYVENFKSNTPFGHPFYQDPVTQKQYKFRVDFESYEDEILPYHKTPNQLIETGVWQEVTPPLDQSYSYAGCCSVTQTKQCGGELLYELGHVGQGVCVQSGRGDGSYPVFVEYNQEGRVKRLIVEFE